MNIEEIVRNREDAYLYLERYVNNGSPSGFDKIHTSSKNTAPREGSTTFRLPIIEFDDSIAVSVIGTDPILGNSKCFFCHPDNLNNPILLDTKDHWSVVDEILVAPTASARTVKWIDHDYFIKLDYMGYLGRITRNLDFQHILSASEVTRDIKSGINSKKYNPKFGLLSEDNGKVAYISKINGDIYEFGYILREARPYPIIEDGELYIIPGFSLFGTDITNKKDELIIMQLLKKSGLDVNQFAFEKVFKPLIDCYFDPLVHHGLAMESHAQNTLFAIDNNFEIRLIVSRDMESVDKDLPLRRFLNVSSEIKSCNYKCLRETDYNYAIKHSFMYDFKFGEYLLTPLFDAFSREKGFDEKEIKLKIKKLSNTYIKMLPASYFPEVWYTYDNIQFNPGEKRPYISHNNPKYR